MGLQVHLAVGWVGLGQLFGGLGWVWVDEMDPWTTLLRTPTNIGITLIIYHHKLESLRYISAAGSMGLSSFKF